MRLLLELFGNTPEVLNTIPNGTRIGECLLNTWITTSVRWMRLMATDSLGKLSVARRALVCSIATRNTKMFELHLGSPFYLYLVFP